MKLSENQERALKHIDEITEHFGNDRWFIQSEIVDAGYKTLMALVNKGYLRTQEFDCMTYYQRIK